MNIGFLGLGTMGQPMALNLIKAGHQLRVWNRSAARAAPLVAAGAVMVDQPAAVAEDAQVVISMLADDAVTMAVILDGGVLDRLPAGALHINMATISVAGAIDLAARHQARGVGYLAAPVLGRVNVAEAGALNIIAAGAPELIEQAGPLFAVLGRRVWSFGDRPEQANAIKLAVNFMIASAIATMGEASALVRGHGAEPADFIELITSTVFATPVYQGYGRAMAEDRVEPAGFKLALGAKDVRLALAAAEQALVPLPIASLLRDQHLDSLAHGEGHLDWAALGRVAARHAAQG